MEINYRIIDDWHPSPDALRELAQTLDFHIPGNYPGQRTECCEVMWEYAEEALTQLGYAPERWPMGCNGAFQLCLEGDTTWVHSDQTRFAGIWFLTPNELCPPGHGTNFYRHTPTGAISKFSNEDPYEDFEVALHVPGNYNRLLIYQADTFHASAVPGFGQDVSDGRLTMTFFWD